MKIAIIGSALAGGSVQIIDLLLDDNLASDIRIYDDREDAQGCEVLGVPVVGPIDRIDSDASDGFIDSAVIAVGSVVPRRELFERFSETSLYFPNIISSKSIISRPLSWVWEVVLPNVYLGPRVSIGAITILQCLLLSITILS